MNRIKIIASILLVIGVVLPFLFENDTIDLFAGILIGLGVGLIISNRITRDIKKSKNVS